MRILALAAAAMAALIVSSCSTLGAMTDSNDPYLWLEDIEGDRALAWVREQNQRSLAQLEGDARYAQLYADAVILANSRDRLPTGSGRDGYYYNFWQDESHVRGIWRRSPLAAYAAGAPQWETLLDVDALAASENANWVYKDAECLEGSTRCMISLSDGGRESRRSSSCQGWGSS